MSLSEGTTRDVPKDENLNVKGRLKFESCLDAQEGRIVVHSVSTHKRVGLPCTPRRRLEIFFMDRGGVWLL